MNKLSKEVKETSIDLNFYEDIYSLIKTISVKDDSIIFNPNSSNYAKLAIEKYQTPIVVKLDEM